MMPMVINIEVRGNEDLSPEWITGFEVGYQGNFGTRLRGSVDIFHNKLDGLIDFDVVETYPENATFPGSPGGIIPSVVSPLNIIDAAARGGEINASLAVTRWLSTFANYSCQYVTDSGTGERIESAPLHKINPGLSGNIGQNSLFSIFANYVDKTVWKDDWEAEKVDSYTLLNFAASHRLLDGDLEIALSVFNLLDDRHLEHPEGTEVGRSVLLKMIYRM